MVKRPQHAPEPLPRRPQRAKSITVELPAWSCPKGLYSMRLIVRPDLLSAIAAAAITSKDGRATLGRGAFTVLVKREASAKGCADHGVRACKVCKGARPPAPAGGAS